MFLVNCDAAGNCTCVYIVSVYYYRARFTKEGTIWNPSTSKLLMITSDTVITILVMLFLYCIHIPLYACVVMCSTLYIIICMDTRYTVC